MDVTLVNPFISATVKVLETMASTKVNPDKPFLKKDRIARGDVTGLIGITGEANGTISVTFDEGSILGIVSRDRLTGMKIYKKCSLVLLGDMVPRHLA